MERQLPFLVSALAVLASPGAAQDQLYGWADPAMQAMDEACLSASISALQSKFEGSSGFEHQRPSDWRDALPGITILLYPNTKFLSSFGDVGGSITCLFDVQKQAAVGVGFQFEGKGLAGLNDKAIAILKPLPEERVTPFYAITLGDDEGNN
ncbi:MAG TPA: hypothetical protein PKA03_13915 [Tabrizicola sp.]|nr:hypothetical protein [Tabrizicola sp.]